MAVVEHGGKVFLRYAWCDVEGDACVDDAFDGVVDGDIDGDAVADVGSK